MVQPSLKKVIIEATNLTTISSKDEITVITVVTRLPHINNNNYNTNHQCITLYRCPFHINSILIHKGPPIPGMIYSPYYQPMMYGYAPNYPGAPPTHNNVVPAPKYDKETERRILNNPYIILPNDTKNGKIIIIVTNILST